MNNTEYTALQKAIEDLYLNTNDNINSVGYSYKIKNNIQTDSLSIRFSVDKKKDMSELSSDEIIPQSITINGREYITDVVEQQLKAEANACYSWNPPDQSIAQHRALASFLQGGISISPPNTTSAGTLGMLCIDNIDRNIIGLTNNHVVISNGFLNSARLQFNPGGPISNTKYIDSNTSDIVQPGKFEGTTTQKIGPIKRYFPLYTDGLNYIDAALIAITNSTLINANSFQQLNNPTNYIPRFATTEEINSLLASPKPKLYKSGRTTGFIGGQICPLEAVSVMETLQVGGYSPYTGLITFSDIIIYKFTENNSNGRPMGGVSIPGDSGSVVLADFGDGVQKIVGLNFAGGSFANGDPQGNAGLACRIDKVASLLNIGPWNGNIKFANPLDWTYYQDDDINNANSITIDINGETYWQIGTI